MSAGLLRYEQALAALDYVFPLEMGFALKSDEEYFHVSGDKSLLRNDQYYAISTTSDNGTKDPLSDFGDFGPLDVNAWCDICRSKNCVRHTGVILFPMDEKGERVMIVHPSYKKTVDKIFEIVCSSCWQLVVDPESAIPLKGRLDKILAMNKGSRLGALHKLLKSSNKISECTRRRVRVKNGRETSQVCPVKTRIISEAKGGTTIELISKTGITRYDSEGRLKKANKQKDKDEIKTVKAPISARTIYEGFMRIPDSDLRYMGLTKRDLKGMFKTLVEVSPNWTRPKTAKNKSDKITACVLNIRSLCANYKPGSGGIPKLEKDLFEAYKTYIDEFTSQIGGKMGWIRSKNYGKRPNFSFRAVIVPYDGKFWETMVSADIAHAQVTPEQVTNSNLEAMQEMVYEGKVRYINKIKGRGGSAWESTLLSEDNFSDRSYHILEAGDIIYRSLITGDVMATGRQPTNTMHNIYGTKIVVLPGRSVTGINIVITGPIFGDFDGDAMHNHVPQTPEAKADVKRMMMNKNLRSAQKNKPVVAPIYHAPIASTILTYDQSVGISREAYLNCIHTYQHAERLLTLDDRLEKRGIKYLAMKEPIRKTVHFVTEEYNVLKTYLEGDDALKAKMRNNAKAGNKAYLLNLPEDVLYPRMERLEQEIKQLEHELKHFKRLYIEEPLHRALTFRLAESELDLEELNHYLALSTNQRKRYVASDSTKLEALRNATTEMEELETQLETLLEDILHDKELGVSLTAQLDAKTLQVIELTRDVNGRISYEAYSRADGDKFMLEDRVRLEREIAAAKVNTQLPMTREVIKKYEHLVRVYSGYELFSTLFPEDFRYDHGGVKVRDGVLMEGTVTASTLGTSHGGIIDTMIMHYMPSWKIPAHFINDATTMLNTFIDAYGFTVKYTDALFAGYMGLEAKQQDEINKITLEILKMPLPTTDEESIIYNKMKADFVDSLQVKIGKELFMPEELVSNGLIGMSEFWTGAKGKTGNLMNISMRLEVQKLEGSLLPKTVNRNRMTIMGRPKSLFPEADGLVRSNYAQRLSPAEMQGHATSNRGQLTSVQTTVPKIGYAQRMLQISLENKIVKGGADVARNKFVHRPVSADTGQDGMNLSLYFGEFQCVDMQDIISNINFMTEDMLSKGVEVV